MAFTRISNADLNSRGATTLADQPALSAALLKEEFDAPAKQVVAPKVNNLMDELEASTAAASLGSTAPTGRSGGTVQEVMNDISSDLATVEAGMGQAIADAHTHDNKALLDTYDQTNADLTDAVNSKHTHSNKSLLDSYNQSNSDLSDAVAKKHDHANKSILDKFGESGGQPTYDGDPIGTVHNAYKNVKVGATTMAASGEDTLTLEAGTHIRLIPDATNKKVTISMEAELAQISVTAPPTKTVYGAGETLDLSGIVVTATYSDALTSTVTNYCIYSPANGTVLTTEDTSVTISYTEMGITKTTTQAITVRELSSIAITTPPTTISYNSGDVLDLTGIEVTATYSDGSTADVTTSCTFSPANGSTLSSSDTAVTASYTYGSSTKTTTQSITVLPPVYGATWTKGSSPAMTRTDDAADFVDPVPAINGGDGSSPFDNIMPWSGMVRETDSDGNVWVKIPKFYYLLEEVGSGTSNGFSIKISSGPREGYIASPAHIDKNDGNGEKDFVYIGAYPMGVLPGSGNAVISKKGDGILLGNKTLSQWRTAAQSASNVYLMDLCMLQTIWFLYLVEYANLDFSRNIGYGRTDAAFGLGDTDEMIYHTGSMGAKDSNTVSIRYRGIDNILVGQNGFWLEGYRTDSSGNRYCITKPSEFGDSSAGTKINSSVPSNATGSITGWYVYSAPNSGVVISKRARLLAFGGIGTASSSYDTYSCDYINWAKNDYAHACLRGKDASGGIFSYNYLNSGNTIYARAMKLPPNT